ncbi:HlyD family efflux transporter periplasmic adaptor subunit [Noviherbaspirillum pedocola]|uniref:HlyD family secretion protein n=1 Tax=Noviherbaspirillum pedocola TaxID=2801341 RepID=A0A934T2X4_9BURK|nr:HlyD family secretion protein [Noviherbaspirillum pedocola]MBK4737228.1 HlyD family secretion protein [Noviherbaspirillum pedocola]
MKHSLAAAGRVAITLIAVGAAILVGKALWQHYEVAPWTRDGRVRANVIQVAPDVSGLVVKVLVHDNGVVKAGDELFEIDPSRFELALRQAEATVEAQRTALAQAENEARRNAQLQDLVSTETREQGRSRVDQIRAALQGAIVARDVAKLNLERSRVVAASDGVVTNLDLYTGGYVAAGRPVLALVEKNSFYVEGYFEETKLPGIHIGDAATVVAMGSRRELQGHVDSFAEAIADRDRATGSNLLPNVNPTFNWVRLAQRIPVRVKLDHVPDDVRLVAGQTVTVEIHDPKSDAQRPADRTAAR